MNPEHAVAFLYGVRMRFYIAGEKFGFYTRGGGEVTGYFFGWKLPTFAISADAIASYSRQRKTERARSKE